MKKNILLFALCAAMTAFIAGCAPPPSDPGQTGSTGPGQTEKETVHISVQYPYYPTEEELVQKADLIIRGTVTGSQVKKIDVRTSPEGSDEASARGSEDLPNNMLYTVYTIRIDGCYKGDAVPGDILEVKILGGVYEGVEYIFEEAPKLQQNGNYLMFLETYKNVPASLLNPIQAIYEDKLDSEANYKSLNPENDLKLSESLLQEMISGKGE